MSKEKGMYDAICLDIDNGPDWTVTDANSRLYRHHSLTQLLHLLSPNGVVAFWSASHSGAFERVLRDMFVHVKRKTVPREKGEDDCVYIASAGKNEGCDPSIFITLNPIGVYSFRPYGLFLVS